MSEINTELAGRLVTGRKRDGRRSYDRQAKAELVQACLQPGASVARIGMQYGINANLLRSWIDKHHQAAQARPTEAERRVAPGAQFVALQIETSKASVAAQAVMLRLHVRLPNGVEFDLGEAGIDELTPVIRVLGGLSCSSSTSR